MLGLTQKISTWSRVENKKFFSSSPFSLTLLLAPSLHFTSLFSPNLAFTGTLGPSLDLAGVLDLDLDLDFDDVLDLDLDLDLARVLGLRGETEFSYVPEIVVGVLEPNLSLAGTLKEHSLLLLRVLAGEDKSATRLTGDDS